MAWIAGANPHSRVVNSNRNIEYPSTRASKAIWSSIGNRDRQRNPAQQPDPENHQEQARDSSEDPDPESFGKELLHEPQAAGAKGDPDGHLAPPHSAACEEQTGDVRAGRRKNQRRAHEQDAEEDADLREFGRLAQASDGREQAHGAHLSLSILLAETRCGRVQRRSPGSEGLVVVQPADQLNGGHELLVQIGDQLAT